MLELQCCTGLSQFESYRCRFFNWIYTGKPGKGELHRIVMSYRSHVLPPTQNCALSNTLWGWQCWWKGFSVGSRSASRSRRRRDAVNTAHLSSSWDEISLWSSWQSRFQPVGLLFFLCWSRSIVSFGIVHGHGWLKVCTSESWTDPELWRRGISVITVYVLVSPVARLRFPRIFQHTPSTYPRPSSNSLWKISFSFGGLGMPGVCFRCMLGFS